MATVVDPEEVIRHEAAIYKQTFGSPAGQEVLADLAVFARATETTFRPDPREHALLEGRREVFLRIASRLNLSSSDLFALRTGRPITLEQ